MTDWNPRANQIFLNVIELETEEERRAYLHDTCGEDPALRAEVEGLLRADQDAEGFLNQTLREPGKTTPFTPAPVELEEMKVGPYQLRSIIAEGGMGVVYEADQEDPVRRTVALKIIKPGMNSKDVISRFEVERQTLALMDHPNIARVLDAGSTESGQPYFVMELVQGTPITHHCDAYRLDIRARLQLFIQICEAVQHAHQKGIIHRDIKPSNVLVTLKDGYAVPKVIDFGVAKALDQPMSEKAHRTRFTQMVGTPLYMSPEQAALSGIDVDTRSDIYSLGVLLYELLTGTTPCELSRLENATYEEFRRIKCEEEPARPSTRVTMSKEAAALAADLRGVDSAKLAHVLRGELDWIVMKSLEKDRQRRYQTARGLASEIERYLKNEPVEAGPPSAAYRVRKFVGRNRVLISAASLALAAMVLGTGMSVWQAIRATNAERLARSRLVIANSALKEADAANLRSRRNRAQALLANGGFLAAVKKYRSAVQQYRAAIQVDPNSANAHNNFAWFLVTCPDQRYHNPESAIGLARKAVEMVPDEGTFWNTLGVSYYRAGKWTDAIDSLERSTKLFGDAGVGFNATFIAMAQWQLGNHEEAHSQFDTAVKWMRENQMVDEELFRFCREAAELLGRQDEKHEVDAPVDEPESARDNVDPPQQPHAVELDLTGVGLRTGRRHLADLGQV